MRPSLSIVVLLCALTAAASDKKPRPLTLLFVGGSAGDGETPTLSSLKERLADADPESMVVVFTGNYGSGESNLRAHVDATHPFFERGGKVYFLTGATDFSDGTKAVKRTRKFFKKAFGDDVMPEAACGTTTLLELTKNVGLLLVNSQWWMADWLNDKNFNEGCETKTRAEFQLQLTDAFRDYRSRRLVIAAHHPLGSYGPWGGAFTAAAHADPAPIIGTAWVLARQAGLVEQYRNHPMVNSYVDLVLNEAQRNGAYVFVSGHDASEQFVTLGAQTQIIAGTSAREAEPVTKAREGDFAAAVPGWVELQLDEDGAGNARFVSAAFPEPYVKSLPPPARLAPEVFEAPAPLPASPTMAAYTKKPVWKFPGVLKLLIGSFYSDAYLLQQPYAVLDLDAATLKPFKTGGGLQTNSLRALDADGADYSLRATTKDSGRVLPWPLNQAGFIGRLLDHGYTASHPEAALAVPVLASALGVLHTTPTLVYLPDQEALKGYRGFITNEVVMLEQRPKEPAPESMVGPAPEHGKAQFKSFEEMEEKLAEKPKKNRLDQEAMLRARLLDVFIGDWDRHRGQWTFVGTEDAEGVRTFRPIPRDRDQAFGNYDGLGLMVARLLVPQSRSLQPFTGSYGRLGWLNYNARDVDARVLNQISHARWSAIAAEVQAALTDQVIDDAMATWHREAFELDGARVAAALKMRRDGLTKMADEFFALVNENVDVAGSEDDDVFEVHFEAEGKVRVVVKPWFDRTFDAAETDELRLYGLEGDDTLEVHGTPHRKICIRFVGGEGKDVVTGEGAAPAISFYDSEKGGSIAESLRIDDQRSDLARLNQYDPWENHEPDYGSFFPGLLINPDDGVYVGGTFSYVMQGYKKAPFAAKHDVTAYVATATLGVEFDYRGVFPQSLALLDQQVDVIFKTPTYARNFFGLTNTFINSANPDYYRVRQGHYEARYGVAYGFGSNRTRVGAQLVGQALVTEATPGRFVSVSDDVRPEDLGPRYFLGARLFAETNTYDSLTLPRRGAALHASVESRYDVARGNQFSTTYKLAGAVAIPFDRDRRFVLLSRASVEGIVGEHPFYFAPTLGGDQLRAYQRQQLAGDFAFAHTTDLRIDVFRLYSVIPGTVGIHLSAEHGRVSGGGTQYHLNLGGGVWWSIADLFGVSASFFQGLDGGSRFTVAIGPLFSSTGF